MLNAMNMCLIMVGRGAPATCSRTWHQGAFRSVVIGILVEPELFGVVVCRFNSWFIHCDCCAQLVHALPPESYG